MIHFVRDNMPMLMFGGMVLFLGLVWGLMFTALGLVIMSTGRSWMSWLGVAAAGSSTASMQQSA